MENYTKQWDKGIIISPSLITLDLLNIESQVKEVESAGLEFLHLDIVDGYFSPSMPLAVETIGKIRDISNLIFDVHLMAERNDYFVEEILKSEVQQIIFHIETEPHPLHRLEQIKEKGVRAGVALKPSTNLEQIEYVLEYCDTVLLMLINPGYAGSKGEQQVKFADRKIRALRKMIEAKGLDTKIEIDGRVSRDNIRTYKDIVDIFVAGSTCINRNDLIDSIGNLLELRTELLYKG